MDRRGPLAHLVERLLCKQEATGSSPVGSTTRTPFVEFFCFLYNVRMKLLNTKLSGLMLFELEDGTNGKGDFFTDNRGGYVPFWNFKRLRELGLPDMGEVKQVAFSKSKRGVIRGIHAEPWDKLIYVAIGKVFAVEVDMRGGSPTYGQHETFELDDHKVLFVPKGFGNSFQALEDSYYFYQVNGEWTPETKYEMISYKDPSLGIKWPLWDERIVSEKDESYPIIKKN